MSPMSLTHNVYIRETMCPVGYTNGDGRIGDFWYSFFFVVQHGDYQVARFRDLKNAIAYRLWYLKRERLRAKVVRSERDRAGVVTARGNAADARGSKPAAKRKGDRPPCR